MMNLLFSKPVYRVENLLENKLDDLEQSARKVITEVLESGKTLDNVNFQIRYNSNLGSIESTYSIVDDLNTHPEFQELTDLILHHVKQFMTEVGFKPEVIDQIHFKKCWANLSQEGDFNFPHNHNNCIVSGLFYIKAPVNSRIYFFDDLNKTRDGHLVIQAPSNDVNREFGPEWFFNCTPGTIMIWKSDLVHANKTQPPGDKVAIIFNLGV